MILQNSTPVKTYNQYANLEWMQSFMGVYNTQNQTWFTFLYSLLGLAGCDTSLSTELMDSIANVLYGLTRPSFSQDSGIYDSPDSLYNSATVYDQVGTQGTLNNSQFLAYIKFQISQKYSIFSDLAIKQKFFSLVNGMGNQTITINDVQTAYVGQIIYIYLPSNQNTTIVQGIASFLIAPILYSYKIILI